YAHARILRDYGSTAGNPTGHLKSMLTGNHCLFPVVDGKVVKGDAQEIYFMEFDGPSQRSYTITVQGE
ncbi:MAG: YjbQ family protein, partial [Anaerolineaceae bacterium]|nr:YjbQ family protein [Anaerolineaceae bacterium]